MEAPSWLVLSLTLLASLAFLSTIFNGRRSKQFKFPPVVASSAEMAAEFLKKHEHIFASRPQTAAGKYTTYNYAIWYGHRMDHTGAKAAKFT
ncbi:hypothetical protein V6N12_052180 [Hibiscus sabdariffa]|uniref:Uncharacterized protein n=1 Tax=Hibiscus sabdariffa TaxID=183260 RepID=A0ABR2GIP8_9ROSI